MATYFVVGASRGIGFELVNQALLSVKDAKVIAGVRNPSAPALVELQKSNARLSIVKIDLESDQSVKDAAAQVSKSHPNGIDLTAAQLLSVLNVNVAGFLRVVTEFLPLVRKSQRKVVISISSLSVTLAFAKDHKEEGIIFVPVHPGVVETDMFVQSGGSRNEFNTAFLLTPVDSAKKMLEAYHKLTIEDSGKFFAFNGEVAPL